MASSFPNSDLRALTASRNKRRRVAGSSSSGAASTTTVAPLAPSPTELPLSSTLSSSSTVVSPPLGTSILPLCPSSTFDLLSSLVNNLRSGFSPYPSIPQLEEFIPFQSFFPEFPRYFRLWRNSYPRSSPKRVSVKIETDIAVPIYVVEFEPFTDRTDFSSYDFIFSSSGSSSTPPAREQPVPPPLSIIIEDPVGETDLELSLGSQGRAPAPPNQPPRLDTRVDDQSSEDVSAYLNTCPEIPPEEPPVSSPVIVEPPRPHDVARSLQFMDLNHGFDTLNAAEGMSIQATVGLLPHGLEHSIDQRSRDDEEVARGHHVHAEPTQGAPSAPPPPSADSSPIPQLLKEQEAMGIEVATLKAEVESLKAKLAQVPTRAHLDLLANKVDDMVRRLQHRSAAGSPVVPPFNRNLPGVLLMANLGYLPPRALEDPVVIEQLGEDLGKVRSALIAPRRHLSASQPEASSRTQ